MALETELHTWKALRENLSEHDKKVFDQLIQYVRKHGDAGSLAARPLLSEVVFFSIALEQQKKIKILEKTIQDLEIQLEDI